MNDSTDSVEERELRSIARRYKRKGYRVTVPKQGGALPTFLRGFTPDLIAESDHDRVIVEVKQKHALHNSNELQGVAERVSREPGWRFELVTVQSPENTSTPDIERMEYFTEQIRQTMDVGLNELAYVYAWSIIEVLLNDLGLKNKIITNRTSIGELARELVSLGVVPRDTLDVVEQARAVRNHIVHATSKSQPSNEEVERLLTLGRRLHGELIETAAE